MGQTTYSSGLLAILVSDLINRAICQNAAFASGSPDFIRALQITLPKYAKSYTGSFYIKGAQSGAPTNFPTAEESGTPLTNGSFYPIPYPSDALNDGILSFEILTGVSNLVLIAQGNIVQQPNETLWDVSSTNTTKIYWRMVSRIVRMYVPSALLTTAPMYSVSYVSFPTYPTATTDYILIPAEDYDNFMAQWMGEIRNLQQNNNVVTLSYRDEASAGVPALLSTDQWVEFTNAGCTGFVFPPDPYVGQEIALTNSTGTNFVTGWAIPTGSTYTFGFSGTLPWTVLSIT